MDSRDIERVEKFRGVNMFVLHKLGVLCASDIAISLYKEVQALRKYGNKDCIAMVDKELDELRDSEVNE